MQAIILAAGMGRRLGRLTQDNTKCMLPVNGTRIIDRMLSHLIEAGIKRVIIVVGYKRENLISHIGNRYDDRLEIVFVENPIFDKTNNIYSLALAKDHLCQDDTLLLESDLVFEQSMLQRILSDPRPNLALVDKYETWMDGTMVKIDAEGNILNFVPKKAFRYADVAQYWKTCNIYKFSKDFSRQKYVPFLEAYCSALGNNEYYEQVLRVITLLNSNDLQALPADGCKWYEIDDVQDLDIAETIFAPEDQMLHKYMRRYGGHWRFPHMADFCYLVNPYFPTPRMKDEMRANFDTLLTEYPSGMYVNSLLAAKYFGISQNYIVPGNGAAELIKILVECETGRLGIVRPTFEEYPNRMPQYRVVSFQPDNDALRYSADDMMEFFSKNSVATLLLINPDNPSGNFIPKADVLRLAEWAHLKGVRLVVDESFVDFSDDFENNSLLSDDILCRYPSMAVVKSISKSYGVPGLRLGILASANDDLIHYVRRNVSIWNINSFAEFYMQIFGKYEADYAAACRKFAAERTRFMQSLADCPLLQVFPSQANYFLCRVMPPYTSHTLTETLLRRFDILIKDCDTKHGLEGKNYVRISVRNQQDNDRLVEALHTLSHEDHKQG